MPHQIPPKPHSNFRFGLPPSLGSAPARERAERLESYLGRMLGQRAEVSVGQSYDGLAKDLLAGRLDAAWAPPFVCARLEAMGVRVLLRGIRRGASSYRAALLCRADKPLGPDRFAGLTAAWVDRNSVGGYLLAMAYLRSRGVDPAKAFFGQTFLGSYQAALEAVLEGKADVTSVFVPDDAARESGPGQHVQLVEDLLPGASGRLSVVAYTEASPNDGVAVSMSASPEVVGQLERSFLDLDPALLRDVFDADRFEPAPRMSYRALYRVALASL